MDVVLVDHFTGARRSVMTIYVCDDNELDRERVCRMLKIYLKYLSDGITFQKFDGAEQMLAFMKKDGEKPDLVFLDIYMEGMNGIELGERLFTSFGGKIPVIFTTSSDDHAIDAFKIRAMGYLHKPYTQQDFDHAMKRVEKLFENNGKYVEVKIKGKEAPRRVYFDEILYMESAERGTRVHLCGKSGKDHLLEESETIHSMTPMKSYRDSLEGERCFVECGRSYLVNLRYAQEIDEERMRMSTGDSVPIPLRCRSQVQDQLTEWRKHGGNICV